MGRCAVEPAGYEMVHAAPCVMGRASDRLARLLLRGRARSAASIENQVPLVLEQPPADTRLTRDPAGTMLEYRVATISPRLATSGRVLDSWSRSATGSSISTAVGWSVLTAKQPRKRLERRYLASFQPVRRTGSRPTTTGRAWRGRRTAKA